jgi:hypothetical protein
MKRSNEATPATLAEACGAALQVLTALEGASCMSNLGRHP